MSSEYPGPGYFSYYLVRRLTMRVVRVHYARLGTGELAREKCNRGQREVHRQMDGHKDNRLSECLPCARKWLRALYTLAQ